MLCRLSGYLRFELVALLSLSLVAALQAAPVVGEGEPQFVFGVVVSLAQDQAVVGTNTGPVTVQLSPDTQYEREAPGTLQDIQPGDVVGVTGRPVADGLSAVEIHVFPKLMTVRQGQNPMSGANAGNLMTNAEVASVADGVLTLQFAGQVGRINTSADATVTRTVPATAADVQEGVQIGASGPVGPDGDLQASSVWIRARS